MSDNEDGVVQFIHVCDGATVHNISPARQRTQKSKKKKKKNTSQTTQIINVNGGTIGNIAAGDLYVTEYHDCVPSHSE